MEKGMNVDISNSVEDHLVFLLKLKPHLLKTEAHDNVKMKFNPGLQSQQVGIRCRQNRSLVVPGPLSACSI